MNVISTATLIFMIMNTISIVTSMSMSITATIITSIIIVMNIFVLLQIESPRTYGQTEFHASKTIH